MSASALALAFWLVNTSYILCKHLMQAYFKWLEIVWIGIFVFRFFYKQSSSWLSLLYRYLCSVLCYYIYLNTETDLHCASLLYGRIYEHSCVYLKNLFTIWEESIWNIFTDRCNASGNAVASIRQSVCFHSVFRTYWLLTSNVCVKTIARRGLKVRVIGQANVVGPTLIDGR